MKILVFGLQGSGKGDVAKHLSEQIKGVHIDASEIRSETENWSWSIQDRKKVCEHLGIAAHGVELSDKIAVIEGIIEFYEDRRGLKADYIIWANTRDDCTYDDTSMFFQVPNEQEEHDIDYVIETVNEETLNDLVKSVKKAIVKYKKENK